jgi:hypothetical protein
MIVAADIDSYSFGSFSLSTSASCNNTNALSIGRFGIGGDFTRHSTLIEHSGSRSCRLWKVLKEHNPLRELPTGSIHGFHWNYQ